MARLTPEQKKQVFEHLGRERYQNYSSLEYYLKQILSGRDVQFRAGQEVITASTNEAWELINSWGVTPEGGLPLGDRGSVHVRATRLLSYLQTNLIGKSAEAAASYRLLLSQKDQPLFGQGEVVDDPTGKILQKALELQRIQISTIQNRLLNPLTVALDKTKFLQNIPDPQTRALVLQMIAAGNINFRTPTPENINHLLLSTPGHREINVAIHRAYSLDASKEHLAAVSQAINETIAEAYPDENDYLSDMSSFRTISALSPSLGDIEYLVGRIAFASSPAEKQALTKNLRIAILESSYSPTHSSGSALIATALKSSGLSSGALAELMALEPILEKIEVSERFHLLGHDLEDRDPRLIATSRLAAALGVDLTTPWLNPDDLKKITTQVLQRHGATSLEEAISKVNNPQDLIEVKGLIDKTRDFDYYQGSIRGSLLLQAQELFAKTNGGFASAAHPIFKLKAKIWAGFSRVDDVVQAPIRGLSDGILKIQEKYPLLDPVKFLLNKWTTLQIGVASKINAWAINVKTTSWLSGFAGHMADFTEGFTKHNADWGGATHFFFERKWGNVLDWAAKGVGHESWAMLKSAAWKGIERVIVEGGNKLASGLGSKIATALAGLGTSGTGIGLVILGAQVAWELGKAGFSKLKDFITNKDGFRDQVLNWLPVALGGVVTFVVGLPALALAGVSAAILGPIAFLGTVLTSLAGLFMLASGVAMALLVGFALLFFVFKPTTELDVSSELTQIFTNIVCDKGESGASPVATCASCLVDYLSACYGESVTGADFQTTGLGCLIAKAIAPDAAAIIERSASSFTYLQCVGFVQASIACAGGSLAGVNACGYAGNVAPGYQFVSGLAGAKQGDPVVFRSSGTCSNEAPGHIGILSQDAGALVCIIDANQTCPGCVNANNCLPKTNVAGYLKKI